MQATLLETRKALYDSQEREKKQAAVLEKQRASNFPPPPPRRNSGSGTSKNPFDDEPSSRSASTTSNPFGNGASASREVEVRVHERFIAARRAERLRSGALLRLTFVAWRGAHSAAMILKNMRLLQARSAPGGGAAAASSSSATAAAAAKPESPLPNGLRSMLGDDGDDSVEDESYRKGAAHGYRLGAEHGYRLGEEHAARSILGRPMAADGDEDESGGRASPDDHSLYNNLVRPTQSQPSSVSGWFSGWSALSGRLDLTSYIVD